MNVGDVFSDSVRRSVAPAPRAAAAGLHVDVEQDLGVVADEADRHDQQLLRAAGARARESARDTSGPSHGSGVRPAL